MPAANASKEFYRCRVSEELSRATLCVGRKRIPATLRETSIDGFSVLVKAKLAKRLAIGRTWVLTAGEERTEVGVEWMYQTTGGDVQIGLRRLADLTPNPEPRGGWRTHFGRTTASSHSDTPSLAFAGMLMIIVIAISTPAIGDPLGTAPRIQGAFDMLVGAFAQLIQ